MDYIATYLRSPVFLTLAFGLLNGWNWCRGVCRPGCTGHEIPMLMSFAIPFCAGVVSTEAAWFTAIVMIIPAVLTVSADTWQNELVEYGIWYLANLAFVVAGRGIRRQVVARLMRPFGQGASARASSTER